MQQSVSCGSIHSTQSQECITPSQKLDQRTVLTTHTAHSCTELTRPLQPILLIQAQAGHHFTGSGTAMVRSKRPGRVSAGSRDSGMLVAAITITPSFTCSAHAHKACLKAG